MAVNVLINSAGEVSLVLRSLNIWTACSNYSYLITSQDISVRIIKYSILYCVFSDSFFEPVYCLTLRSPETVPMLPTSTSLRG